MIKNKNDLYQSKNYQKLIRLKGFIKIPLTLAVWHDLTPAECMIYAYIDNATNYLKDKAFTDNETTLQALCNISKKCVRNSLANLCDKGLTEKIKIINKDGKEKTAYRSLQAVQLEIQFNT